MSLTSDVKAFDVMDVLRKTIQAGLPGAKRAYFERIDKATLPAISVEIVRYTSPQIDSERVRRTLALDVIYLSQKNTVSEALGVMEVLGAILPFGLPVKDRYVYLAEGPEMRLVDQDLHMLITYRWIDYGDPVALTETGKLGRVDEGETSIGNIVHERDPYLKPVLKRDEDGQPVEDDQGLPVVEENIVEPNFEYMQNLIVEMEE